jgi:hypothetical protein
MKMSIQSKGIIPIDLNIIIPIFLNIWSVTKYKITAVFSPSFYHQHRIIIYQRMIIIEFI